MDQLLCPNCYKEQPLTTTLCMNCSAHILLQERYRLRKRLGAGGSSQVFLADDQQTQESRAIKVLQIQGAKDWKGIEHFERQLSILRSLSHAGIPKVFEHFEQELLGKLSLFSVQQWVEGESLASQIKRGHRYREADAKQLLEKLLEIVSYLHSFSPPVIHRDIKPSNIMIRSDGTPVIIDFDTARGVAIDREKADGTMVGTAGFVPMEQLSGQAAPASDIYSLGMTLVAALSHKDIIDLPVERMRIKFEGFVNVSGDFLAVLQKMVEPAIEDRYQSTSEVIEALKTKPKENTHKHRQHPIPKKANHATPQSEPQKQPHKREVQRKQTIHRKTQGDFNQLEEQIQAIQAEGPQAPLPEPLPLPSKDYTQDVRPVNFFDLEDQREGKPSKRQQRQQQRAQSPRAGRSKRVATWIVLISIVAPLLWLYLSSRKTEPTKNIKPPGGRPLPEATGESIASITYRPPEEAQYLGSAVWASEVIDFSSEWAAESYAAKQVLGFPDVFPVVGTNSKAWSPKEMSDGVEWVSVRFPETVEASYILVVESASAGELFRIDDLSTGTPQILWQRPTTLPPPSSKNSATSFYLETPRRISALRIIANTKLTIDWSEIDAIGLVPAAMTPR